MNKLLEGCQKLSFAHCGIKFLLDEVLHSLDIMVGYCLDVLHSLGIGKRKLTVNFPQVIKQAMVEILELGQRQLTKSNEIFYLYAHPVSYQCILREIVCQGFCLTPIAAIYRRDGCQ